MNAAYSTMSQFFNAILADTTDMSQIRQMEAGCANDLFDWVITEVEVTETAGLTEPGPHNRDNRNRTANDAQPHGPRTKKAGFAKACLFVSDSHRFTYPIDEQSDNGTSKNSSDEFTALFNRKIVLFQKREFIPIPSLKDDFIVFHMKKSTSAKSELIFPFHYRPFSIFKNILYDTNHFSRCKFILQTFHGSPFYLPPVYSQPDGLPHLRHTAP